MASATKEVMGEPATLRVLALEQIVPSKTNPRKVTEKDCADLTASIKEHGIQVPIIVRPIDGNLHEIVAGERRWTAAKMAGLQFMPSLICSLSDAKAREVQIVENLQRADLHPLDEAHGLQRLVTTSKPWTADPNVIAAKVGKPVAYVAQRLKLLDLLPAAADMFRKGDILLGHALELCRISHHDQDAAVKWMADRAGVETREGYKEVGKVMKSVAELKAWIQGNVLLDLSKAPFDTTDAKLNPKMGACTGCPYRTGNEPALFADIKSGDLCTLPSCFQVKQNKAIDLKVEQMQKDRGVKKLLRVGIGWRGRGGSVPVDVHCSGSYGEPKLVRDGDECKDTKPGIIVFVAHGEKADIGKEVNVCVKPQECKKHSGYTSSGRSAPVKLSATERCNRRIANLKKELPQLERNAIFKALAEKAAKGIPSQVLSQVLKICALESANRLYGDRNRDICNILGVEAPKNKGYGGRQFESTVRKHFDRGDALLVAVTAASDIPTPYHGGDRAADNLLQLAKLYRLPVDAVRRAVRKEVQVKMDAARASEKRSLAKAHKQAVPGHSPSVRLPKSGKNKS